MSVHYQIVFRDGAKLDRVASCFGATAYPDWNSSFGHGGSADATNARRPASDQSFIQLFMDYLHPCWQRPISEETGSIVPLRSWQTVNNTPEQSCRRLAEQYFMEEAKLLLEDCPSLQKVITLHPLLKVVRGHFKNTKADQIILSMFCLRNLMSYSQIAYTYRHLRNLGYRPRVAIVVAHQVTKNYDAMGQVRWTDQRTGETNWICPETFGSQSLLDWMGQDIDSQFGFNQEPWRVQRGYRRDNWYSGNRQIFDDSRTGYGMNWVTMEPYLDRTYRNYRKLVDSYSVPNDEPIPGQTFHGCVGFYILSEAVYRGSQNGNPVNNGVDCINSYMEQLSDFLREQGFNPMSE